MTGRLLFLCIIIKACCSNAIAQLPVKDTSVAVVPAEIKSVTRHSAVIGGKTVNYTATSGALILMNDNSEPIALFGYTAYTKDDDGNAKRPVTFSYNGGPGSSSYWLHMGVIGPRRVVLSDPGYNGPPPYKVEDNANSILDVTDIVMIDPVGTGLSIAVGKGKNKDFWGVDGDIKSVSMFIRQYVAENNRWNSPKFLLGESYGTLRSAGVADYLQENMGMVMNGIILVSSVLDMHSVTFQQYDDMPYIFYLPSYAATAWYHNKIRNKSASLEAFLKEVKTFAEGEYTTALMKGDRLSDAEKNEIAAKMADYTGLDKEYILCSDLRVTASRFSQQILKNERSTVGRMDSRYKGINQYMLCDKATSDPQSEAITPLFSTAFMNYYYGELKMNTKFIYHTSSEWLDDFDWDWDHKKSDLPDWGKVVTPNTAVDLAEAMSRNPALKVLVLNGYYDLATPFFATEYTFSHLHLDKTISANIKLKYYPAGHMMYINDDVATMFKKDVGGFITSAIK